MPILTEKPTSSFADASMSGAGFPPDHQTDKGDFTIKPPAKPTDDAAAKAAQEKTEADTKLAADGKTEEARLVAEKAEAEKGGEAKPDLSNPNLASEKPKAETEIPRPKGMDEKGFQTWKKLHIERDTATKERDTLKAEFEAFKAESAKNAPEIDSLKKELAATKAQLDEQQGEISITRIEASKHFKETVGEPQKRILAKMSEMAKRYEIPEKSLLDVIQESDPAKQSEAMTDAIADFKLPDQHKVVQAAEQWSELQEKANSLRADASKKLEEINREAKGSEEKILAENKRDYQAAAAKAWNGRLETTATLKKVDGATAWNDHLDAIGKKVAELDPNDVDLERLADMATAQEAVPLLESSVKHLQAQNQKLADELKAEKARNAAFLKQSPAAGGGHGGNVADIPKSGSGRLAEGMPVSRH
ncbi:MAG: hypothetical protein WBD81_18005 [Collimonas pratensis]|uniref:hypothetical protein n=1 Tax=Collimonas pratensis TaxID=279113 RepID=UPI003C761BA2